MYVYLAAENQSRDRWWSWHWCVAFSWWPNGFAHRLCPYRQSQGKVIALVG